jgi:hypothetical protein
MVATFPWLSGEVPFGASPADTEPHGRDLYARAVAGEFGAIAAYVAPVIIPTIPQSLTPRQFWRAVRSMGLTVSVNAAIAAADEDTQIDAREALEFRRDWPALVAIAVALGKTEADIDALFVLGATF